MRGLRVLITACGLSLGLVGCTSSGQDELREWMQVERSNIKPQVKPMGPGRRAGRFGS